MIGHTFLVKVNRVQLGPVFAAWCYVAYAAFMGAPSTPLLVVAALVVTAMLYVNRALLRRM